MIRLKSLLIEDKSDSNKIRVLAVGDDFSKPKSSFINRLFRLKQIDGDKFINSNASSESMMNTVRNEINNGYNVVIVFCSGRNERKTTLLNVIENFSLITRFAQKADVKCILCTIPSFDYIDNKKDQADDKFQEKIDRINNWLTNESAADDIIDVNFLTDKETLFTKDGTNLNDEGNNQIFKRAVKIISAEVSIEKDVKNSAAETVVISGKKYDIDDIQQKLKKKGINASKDDIRDGKVDKEITKIIPAAAADTEEPEEVEVQIGSEQRGTANQIINYLVKQGLSPAGAAGVTGNLYVESAATFSTTIKGDHGTSIGLAQWHNERWTGKNGLVSWCKSNGKDPYSIEGQLDFLMWELSKSYKNLLEELKTATDPESAAYSFTKSFERPAAKYAKYDLRKRYAKEFFEKHEVESKEEPEKSKTDAESEEPSKWNSLTNIFKGLGTVGTVAGAAALIATDSKKITSKFADMRGRHKHLGIDYQASKGTKISILKSGKVLRAGNWNPTGWGNCVEIEHEDGSVTRYAHLSKINVTSNDQIDANTIIGETGGRPGDPGAGSTTGEHLHWEYFPAGSSKQSNGESVADEYFSLG